MANGESFKKVLFNAGEQATYADFVRLSKLPAIEHLAGSVIPGLTNNRTEDVVLADPSMADFSMTGDFGYQIRDLVVCTHPASGFVQPSGIARQLIMSGGGNLLQWADENLVTDPSVEYGAGYVSGWCTSADFGTLTTAAGHATLPRIDIVEMRFVVEYDSENRVTKNEAERAVLDIDPLTPNVDTIVGARVLGESGNSVSLQLIADGSGVGSITNNGYAVAFHFQTGVTTVANFETAIQASNILMVETPGTGSNVFAAGDVEAATFLTGGQDSVVSGSSVQKYSRITPEFQIKAGTPEAAATMNYPTPTAGWVAMAAIYIPPTHNAVHDVANIRDLRVPAGGVRTYDIPVHELKIANTGDPTACWTYTSGSWFADGPVHVSGGKLYALCPASGPIGRLLAVGIHGYGAPQCKLVKISYPIASTGQPTITEVCTLANGLDDVIDAASNAAFALADMIKIADGELTAAFPGDRPASSRVGMPIWTNGHPAGPAMFSGSDGLYMGQYQPFSDRLALQVHGISTDRVHFVRFIVAHGMG